MLVLYHPITRSVGLPRSNPGHAIECFEAFVAKSLGPRPGAAGPSCENRPTVLHNIDVWESSGDLQPLLRQAIADDPRGSLFSGVLRFFAGT